MITAPSAGKLRSIPEGVVQLSQRICDSGYFDPAFVKRKEIDDFTPRRFVLPSTLEPA